MSDDEQPKNRGGRPRAADPKSAVSIWIPSETHDRLIRLASARGQAVSECARELIVIQLDRKK